MSVHCGQCTVHAGRHRRGRTVRRALRAFPMLWTASGTPIGLPVTVTNAAQFTLGAQLLLVVCISGSAKPDTMSNGWPSELCAGQQTSYTQEEAARNGRPSGAKRPNLQQADAKVSGRGDQTRTSGGELNWAALN